MSDQDDNYPYKGTIKQILEDLKKLESRVKALEANIEQLRSEYEEHLEDKYTDYDYVNRVTVRNLNEIKQLRYALREFLYWQHNKGINWVYKEKKDKQKDLKKIIKQLEGSGKSVESNMSTAVVKQPPKDSTVADPKEKSCENCELNNPENRPCQWFDVEKDCDKTCEECPEYIPSLQMCRIGKMIKELCKYWQPRETLDRQKELVEEVHKMILEEREALIKEFLEVPELSWQTREKWEQRLKELEKDGK